MNAAVAQLINEQINKEFYSAYLYLDFANYYAAAGLDGFENWYRVQAQEERDHALLFFQYLLNNGVAVSFGAIDAPDWTRGDHMTPLKKALEHEQYVTSLINGIYAAAYDDRDFRTMQLLDWFVKEQGGSVMLALFANWFYAIALGGLYFLCGRALGAAAYLAIFAAVTAVVCALLLRWVKQRGTRIFAAL